MKFSTMMFITAFFCIGLAALFIYGRWAFNNYKVQGLTAKEWWIEASFACDSEGGVKDILPETREVLCKSGRTMFLELPIK